MSRADADRPGVLVTGGAGHVGHLALQALAAHGADPLVSLDVRARTEPLDGVAAVTGDLRHLDLADLLDRHRVGAVVHCAAIVNPPPGMSEAELHDIEVGGTERVLEACLAAGVEHVTVTSSGAAYGYHLANRGRWLTEDDPVRGSDAFAYSRHKAEVERLLARYRRVHPELGQLVLRPGTILGAGTRNQITDLFERPAVLGLRGTDVPFVIVWDWDVAEVIARGVVERVTGTYNLAGDGVLTLADIARIEGKRLVPLPPQLLARALGVLGRMGLTQYGPEQVDFLRYRPVLANDAMKRAFPGLPRRSTREAYEAYRQGRDRRG
jgi:UDP-glucose 4-epimerase